MRNPRKRAAVPLFRKGQRVQLHAATSEWMQGDRYGEVVGFGRSRVYRDDAGNLTAVRPVRVKLDKSGRVRRFHPDNLFTLEDNPPRTRDLLSDAVFALSTVHNARRTPDRDGFIRAKLTPALFDRIAAILKRYNTGEGDEPREPRSAAGDIRRAGRMDELRASLDARNRRNPPDRGTIIYPRILEIRAQRQLGSKTVYVHKFTSRNPVVGLENGSLLIPARSKPLWGEV